MNIRLIGLFIICSSLGACIDDESDSGLNIFLDKSFSHLEDYELQDFDLDDNYDYWEVRRGPIEDGDFNVVEPEEILFVYDDDAFANLSNQQVAALDASESAFGFAEFCQPLLCPIYGIAMLGANPLLITSKVELLDFFGEIDTEAELHLWLWAHDYVAKTYELVPSGYLAVIKWDNHCGRKGERLVFVDFDGKITTERSISVTTYSSSCS